jgi:hypothetical protein
MAQAFKLAIDISQCFTLHNMDAAQLLRIADIHGGEQHQRRSLISYARKFAGCRGRKRAQATPLEGMCRDTHISFNNRTHAGRIDDIQPLASIKYKKVKGKGTWKHATAEKTLQVSFDKPCKSLSNLASSTTPAFSITYVRDLLFMCAFLLNSGQALGITAVFVLAATATAACAAHTYTTFLVVQLMWDETKFKINPLGEKGRATDVSVMASHGRLLWHTPGCRGTLQDPPEEDIIVSPVIIETTSAAGMWAGFEHVLPKEIMDILKGNVVGDVMACLCLGSDAAASNTKLMAHIENLSPENVIILKGLCKQHATGLCLSPLIAHLDLACASYCIAKAFRQDKFYTDFKQGIMLSIRKNLRWVRVTEVFNADPADTAHAESILEIAYYKRDLRNSTPQDSPGQSLDINRELESLRRKRGKALVVACPGNWKKKEIVFVDRTGLADFEAAVHHVNSLLMAVGFHVLATPSFCKWLSMW